MREIKFEAINKFDGEKITGEYLIFYDGKFYEGWRAFEDGRSLDAEQWAVRQYTGRKDKAGLELYEGDIVTENDELSVCVQMNEAGAFVFVPAHLYPCTLELLTINYGYDTFFENDVPEEYVKIVGNIHQHPELLKTQK